jgi:hypothetical protein
VQSAPLVCPRDTPPQILYKYLSSARIDVLAGRKNSVYATECYERPFEIKPIFEFLFPPDAFETYARPPKGMLFEALEQNS